MAKALKTIAVVAGVAALAVVTGGAAAGLGVSLGTTILGTSISAGALLAGSALASTAASLLVKGPKVPQSQTDRLTANIDPRAFRKTVMGSTAFPIDVRYEEWSGADQEYCDWIVANASHAIDGVDEIWLNTDLAWSRTTGVTAKYAGYFSVPNIVTEGSPANAFTFASGRWNGSARLTGCAYVRLRFKVTGNGKKATSPFSGGIPSRITIIGRGAKLYDPRRDSTVPGGSGPMRADDQSTWRYTADDGAVIGENLALHVLRAVMGWRIRNPVTGEMKLATGSGVPARRLNLASWITAANLCDEAVNRSAGGTEPRYQGAGVVSEGDDPQTVLDALCAACCGRFRDTGGKLSFSIAHDDLAAAATDDGLTDDDVVGPFQWNPDAALASTPNVVRGRYVDATAASLYQLIDFPEVRLASIDGQDRVFPLDLGFVESPSQAQRVAKQVLQRKQYPREFTAPFDIRAWKYGVGDIVPFTFATLSFNRKLFRVKDQELGQNGVCNMTLTVEHRAIYAFDKDDAAPVVGAEPNVYDASKNPLVLAIDDAGRTAEWPNIADTIGTKPEDNATVGAPIGTKVGDRPVSNLLSEHDKAIADIDALEATYGETASAAASAEKASLSERAAAASERAAASSQAIADKAKTDAQAAFVAADGARGEAVAKALDAASSAGAANSSSMRAEGFRDQAGERAGAAQGSASAASTSAGNAYASEGRAATSERNAAGSSSAAAESQRLAALSEGAAGRSASAAATSESTASTKAGEAGESASAARRSETNAGTSAGSASTSAGNAATSERNAAGSSSSAAEYNRLAAQSEGAARGSAGAASSSASFAETKAGEAGGSARAAETSATSARTQADNALRDASTASTQASNAARDASSAYTYSLTSAGITEGLIGADGKVTRLESTVTQNTSAIATLNGDGAARWRVETVSGSNRAQISVFASANGGAGVDIVGDTTFRGKLAIGLNASGPRTVITDTYTMYITGSVMSVYGIGFGSGNQFLEWVGPVKSNLAQCTEADAIRYIRTDGSAYFGGTLNAGTIVNPKRTTSLAADVAVTTGNFGSNGRRRVVTVSYEYYNSYAIYNACPTGVGQPSVIVDLYRGTDANGVLLDSRTFNGFYDCYPGYGQYEAGAVTESLSGSFNVTDDSGGTTAAYYARIRNRNVYLGPQQQTLSLVSVEQ